MSGKRKAISKKVRFEVFKRDGFTCQYCGRTPPQAVLEVDHIVPVCDGGDNDADNLVCSCFECNRGKGGRSLEAVPETLSEKAERVREVEDQLSAYRAVMDARKERLEDESWEVAEIMQPGCSEDGYSVSQRESIKRFLEKLPFSEVQEAAEIAVGKMPYSENKAFKYFCGICWNKLRSDDA